QAMYPIASDLERYRDPPRLLARALREQLVGEHAGNVGIERRERICAARIREGSGTVTLVERVEQPAISIPRSPGLHATDSARGSGWAVGDGDELHPWRAGLAGRILWLGLHGEPCLVRGAVRI